MANQIKSKDYNAIFIEKCYVAIIIILIEDQKDSQYQERAVDSWLDFHLTQVNSFICCVNKTGIDCLAQINNENVFLNV